jgi:hypothetical protein
MEYRYQTETTTRPSKIIKKIIIKIIIKIITKIIIKWMDICSYKKK